MLACLINAGADEISFLQAIHFVVLSLVVVAVRLGSKQLVSLRKKDDIIVDYTAVVPLK